MSEIEETQQDLTYLDTVPDEFYNAEEPKRFDPISVGSSCCRKVVEVSQNFSDLDNISYLNLHSSAMKILETINPNLPIECLINELRNSLYCIYMCHLNKDMGHELALNFVDLFLRQRHEILFQRMMLLFNIESKSDVKFCDIFDFLESERTPDYIKVVDNEVTIIEATAVMNVERASSKKGDMTKGYDSKYKFEIAMLEEAGLKVNYFVVIFDISDPQNLDYQKQIEEIAELWNCIIDKSLLSMIDIIRKEFCNQSRVVQTMMGTYMSTLFNEPYSLYRRRLENVEHLLKSGVGLPRRVFQRLTLSNFMYERLVFMWSRLITLLENQIRLDTQKSELIYETTVNKFKFVPSERGFTKEEWVKTITKDDKHKLVKALRVMHSGVKVEQKPDVEFFYYGDYSTVAKYNIGVQPFFSQHPNSAKYSDSYDYKDFGDKVVSVELKETCSVYEDEEYLGKFIDKMCEWEDQHVNEDVNLLMTNLNQQKKKPFAAHLLNDEMIERAVDLYNDELQMKNCTTDRVVVNHAKQPFIYPIYYHQHGTYASIHTKPTILNGCMGLGGYTDAILKQCLKQEYQFGTKNVVMSPEYSDLKKEIANLQRQSAKLQKLKTKEMGFTTLVKLSDFEEGKSISQDMSQKIKKLKLLKKETGLREKEIPMIRMKTTGKSQWTSQFREEMQHFKTKRDKSVYKGVGLMSNNLQEVYDELKMMLLSPSSECCPVELYDEFISDDVSLMKQLKQDAVNDHSQHYNWLKNSNIYHACSFVSRFCHTLLYYSQNSINSSYVMTDNLGYSNVLLIVKGGKKIFNTKRSKLFRLFFPTYKILKEWYRPPGYKSNFEFREINGCHYCITPWMNMNETLLTDGITLFSRLMGFSLLNYNKELSNYENINQIFFNLILAFHARRQTEAMMHNLRYITVNCLSVITCLDKMLPELAGFNYDCFQAFIRNKLKENFAEFAKAMKNFHDTSAKKSARSVFKSLKIKSLMNDHIMNDLENLACTIYSTYLMSKAPTTQSLEQVSNLKGMLETHKLFGTKSDHEIKKVEEKNCITIDNLKYKDYVDKMFENDFNFDPKMCSLLGNFCADYLKNYTTPSDLHIKWDQMINEPWDVISNSKGLRYEGKEFFGNKGYYVVYKDILKDDPKIIDKLFDSIEDDLAGKKTRRRLDKLNQTFRNRYATKDLSKIVFHVVDKQQRGGKREIFVMDWNTKTHQHSIESFSGHLCKLIPNEMISIPSNKRLSTIHNRVFETVKFSDEENYYWVLDCRKWAPRSMIQKFVHFLMGMRRILPESFIEHSLNFFSLLLRKRVYTRPHIVEILKNSAANKDLDLKFLIEDKESKGYYFEMSYSWMMGIFNYFSSLMHVANQLMAAHMMNLVTTRVYGDHITLHMVAHSDDSAGKLTVPNKFHLMRCAFHYEVLLKSCNHMLSDKKSNMGSIYYEFLSVLYVGGELLSLLAKFLGLFNYHPSDQGLCIDMTDSYSKCMEMIINGSTLSQAYLALKIQSKLIWRFYMQNDSTENAMLLPPQMGGIPDSHPLMVLMCGSDSDLIRLYLTKGEDYILKLSMINKELNRSDYSDDTYITSFRSRPDIRMIDRLSDLKRFNKTREGITDNWGMKNVNFKNTALNAWQFINKLSDPMFLSSLQDESLTRRLSRAFYFRSHGNVQTKFGKVSYKGLRDIISMALLSQVDNSWFEMLAIPDSFEIRRDLSESLKNIRSNQLEVLGVMHSEPLRVLRFLDKVKYSPNDIVNFPKTCKPVHFLINKSNQLPIQNYDPASLVTWIKSPHLRSLLPDTRNFHSLSLQLSEILKFTSIKMEDIDDQKLFIILNKLKSKTITNVYCYSNMPSGYREIETYQDILLFLSHNSFNGKMIQGLAIPFGKSLSMPMSHILNDLASEDVEWSLAFCELMISTYESSFYDPTILGTLVNTPSWLNGEMLTLFELIDGLIKYWEKLPNISQFFQFHLYRLSLILENNRYLDPTQLQKCYYSSFVKRQFLVENTWLGTGQIFVNLKNLALNFTIKNRSVVAVTHNSPKLLLTPAQHKYLDYCLKESQLGSITDHMHQPEHGDWNDIKFGINYDGLLCLQRGSDQHMILNTEQDYTLGCMLSSVSSGTLTTTMKNRLQWLGGNEIDGYKKYKIKLLPINTRNCVTVAQDLLVKNRSNEMLLAKLNIGMQDFLMEVGLSNLDVQYKIEKSSVFNFYNATKLYQVFYEIEAKDIFEVSKVKPIVSVYPGQTGGLLNILIEYSKIHDEFNFSWDRVVSPELMMIKSSQPEAFVSELVTNISEKYNRLFDDTDKFLIIKELSKIMETISSAGKERELLALMANWSHIGVLGAIESLRGEKNEVNFKMFRRVEYQQEYTELYINNFKLFLKAIYDCVTLNATEFHNASTYYRTKHFYKYKITDFKQYFVSAIHLMVLKTYTTYNANINLSISSTLAFFSEVMENILTDETLTSFLQTQLSKCHLLSTLPLKLSNHHQWVVIFNALMEYYITGRKSEYELHYIAKFEEVSGVSLPFIKTKEFMEDIGIKINVQSIRHHGLMTREFTNFVNGVYSMEYRGTAVNIKLEVSEEKLSDLDYVPLNKNYFFKYKLSEEFLKSENFEEAMMELENIEPDMDYILGLGITDEEMYDKEKRFAVKRVFKGKLRDVELIRFKVLLNFSDGYNTQFFDNLRQVGGNILIITDCIPLMLMALIPKVKLFRLNSRMWQGKSLVPTSFYYAIVISEDWDDISFWCELLDSEYVNLEELKNLCKEIPANMFYNSSGELEDSLEWLLSNISDRESKFASSVEELGRVKESDELETSAIKIDESLEKMLSDLKNEFVATEEFLARFKEMWVNERTKPKTESASNILLQVCEGLLNQKNKMDSLIKLKDTVLSGDLTTQEYENIFQVPLVWGPYRSKKSNIRNRALKEPKLISEMEALMPGFSNRIISGTSSISPKLKKRVENRLKICRKIINYTVIKKRNKSFLTDFYTLVLNDSRVLTDSPYDEDWNNVLDYLDEKILDEEEEAVESVSYQADNDGASLKYNPIMEEV